MYKRTVRLGQWASKPSECTRCDTRQACCDLFHHSHFRTIVKWLKRLPIHAVCVYVCVSVCHSSVPSVLETHGSVSVCVCVYKMGKGGRRGAFRELPLVPSESFSTLYRKTGRKRCVREKNTHMHTLLQIQKSRSQFNSMELGFACNKDSCLKLRLLI